MEKINVTTRIWLISLTLLLCLGALAFVSNLKSSKLMNDLDNVSNVQLPASRNMTYADMMHDGIRGVVMESVVAMYAKNEEKLNELNKELDEKSEDFLKYIAELDKLPINQETKKSIEETKPAIQEYVDLSKKTITLASKFNVSEMQMQLKTFETSFKFLEEKMEKLGDLIEKDSRSANDSGKDARGWILSVSILSCLIGSIITLLVSRKTKSDFGKIANELKSVMSASKDIEKKIENASNNVKKSSTTQVSSIQESVAAITQITQLSESTNHKVQSSEQLSEQVYKKTTESQKVMEKLHKEISYIQESNSQLRKIESFFQEIISKTETIDSIVNKIQILSFNATIEAARAGEKGKGFVVVAEEMGNLATVSGKASQEINAIINNSKIEVSNTIQNTAEKVKTGNQTCDNAILEFINIVESIKQVLDNMKNISDNSQSQSAGLQQLLLAMKNMDQVSQDNLDVSNEVWNTVQNLTNQNNILESSIKRLIQYAG